MENTPLSAINPATLLVLTVVVAAQFIYEQSERKHDGYLTLCVTAEVAYLTGQRREDVLGLPLRNVRDDGILFEQKKSNGEMRVLVEWTEALRAAVAKAKALPRPVSGLYLICNRRGQPYTPTKGSRPCGTGCKCSGRMPETSASGFMTCGRRPSPT